MTKIVSLEQYDPENIRYTPLAETLEKISQWDSIEQEAANFEPIFNPDRIEGELIENNENLGLLHSCDDGAKTWLSHDYKGLCTCNQSEANIPCKHINALLIYKKRQTIVEMDNTQFNNVSIKRVMGKMTIEVENKNPIDATINLKDSLAQYGQPTGLNALGINLSGKWYYHDKSQNIKDKNSNKKIWSSVPIEIAKLIGDISKNFSLEKPTSERLWIPESKIYDISELAKSGRLTLPAELDKYVRFSNKARRDQAQPKNMKAVLDKAQLEGVAWLQDLFDENLAGILADEMGVGKTMQILGHIQELSNNDKLKNGALLAVPSGAIDQWADEMRKYIPELEFIVWEGLNRQNLLTLFDETPIVLTTHSLLSIDAKIFKSKKWTFFAVDEAQDGNNPTSRLASIFALIPAYQKIPITGTPVENSLIDLHTLMSISNPGLLGSRAAFSRDIVKKTQASSEDIISVEKEKEGENALDGLHKVVAPFILHRTQSDVGLNVPEPKNIEIAIEMEEVDRELYEAVWRAIMSEEDKKTKAFRSLTLLRQAAADVRLIKGEKRNLPVSTKTKIIAKSAYEKLSEEKRILLFSTWTGHLDLLEAEIQNKSQKAVIARIDGSMSRKQKREVQRAFKNYEIDVLAMTMKAGGRALNLPEADDVFITQSWWNPFISRQAAYRAIRRGQTKTINVSNFIVKDTIEERLVEIQKHKKMLSNSIMRPNGHGAGGLKMKEIINLIDRSSITTSKTRKNQK